MHSVFAAVALGFGSMYVCKMQEYSTRICLLDVEYDSLRSASIFRPWLPALRTRT